jgi:4-aminobutyrate aminotransferase-like enzyme
VDGSYHGHTCSVLEVSPYKYEHSREFNLVKPTESANFASPGKHIWKVPAPDTYRGPHQDPATAGEDYAKYVQEACDFYTIHQKEKVAAFIVEGGMSVPGVILPPPGYLHHSVHAVRAAGGLYIVDEVQTGLGRFGSTFWAFQHQNDTIVPDIVTLGKPFGNGMPLAACVTTPQVAQAFEAMGVEYFNTFGGNPVCAAAGLAVLDTIEQDRLQPHALETGEYLKSQFGALELEIVGDVRGSGLFLGVELVRNRDTKEPATEETSFVCSVLKEKYKILTSIDGIYENVLIIKPPMCFSKDDCDYFVEKFRAAVVEDLAAAGDVRSLEKTPT